MDDFRTDIVALDQLMGLAITDDRASTLQEEGKHLDELGEWFTVVQ